MKKSKKMLSIAMALSMTAVLMSPLSASTVKAAAFTAVAQYDFEGGTGMSSSGISGTAPSVISDSERGNVLQFSDGSGSSIVTHENDPSLEEHSWRIDEGSPSSLKFTNPFKGRSLSGATISFWIKLPNEKAGGVVNGSVDTSGSVANGIVGFVDSEFRLMQHPDCADGGHSSDWWGSRTLFGITAQPWAYFAQIHHNWIISNDTDATLSYNIGTWRYCAVSITNESIKLYVDGKPVEFADQTKGKRFLGSPEYNNPGNSGMPFLLDFLCDNMSYTFGGKAGTTTLIDKNSQQAVTYGKVPSNVQCYVGFTGFSPTYAGVCIDDLTFFTKAFSDGDMAALYEAAKVPGGITVAASGGGSTAAGGSNAGSGASGGGSGAPAVSAEAAAAIAASTHLVSAPDGVTIGTAIPILKGDAALGGTYDIVKGYLDNGIGAIIASNPEWSQLTMSKNIYVQEVPLTGRQLEAGEKAVLEMTVPEGFDMNMVWVLRVNDDGSLTKCNILSAADGKLQFETDHFTKFAIVEMSLGSQLPKTGVVSSWFFLAFGAVIIVGGILIFRKKKE